MSLTFTTDGEFAGTTIRVTSDKYASIYDVMKVAGVGRDPTHTWNELKTRFPHLENSVKYHKFPGRGQRDTPVIHGPGLVRLLFLLPGVNARRFAAEGAETLVRFLGGDDSLVSEIRHNNQVAINQENSTQAFMAANMNREDIASPPVYSRKRTFGDVLDGNIPSPAKRLLGDVDKDTVSKGTSRPGQSRFRNLVIARVRFNGGVRCEASGATRNLDAAHIIPYSRADGSHSHGSWATNGLLLHRSIHTIWDAGFVKLSPIAPFRWTDIDKTSIQALFGSLSPGIISTLEQRSLRSDILVGMVPDDRAIFIDNLKARFESS